MTSVVALGPDATGTFVIVSGGTVVYAGPTPGALPATVLDCTDCRIVPGAVNAHTHVYSGLAPLNMPRPEPAPQNFLQILERVWWPMDRALDFESLRAAARLYVAEALLAGTTTLIDHHESPQFIDGSLDVIADACEQLGMRALLCYGATERNGGAGEAERGLTECRRFITANERPLVRGAVGLHASFTVSDATIEAAGDLCRELGAPLHVHVAEDAADVEDARRRGYDGPLQRLRHFRALVPGSILAHGVHLTEAEVRAADASRLWLVQNPRSNRNNGVGYPRSLVASTRVAVGTDGFPSDMKAETDALVDEAARACEDLHAINPRVEGGHRLAADTFSRRFAPIATGGAADLVAASPDGVRHVIVGGRVAVRDGELTGGNLQSIRHDAVLQAERLWHRMERRQPAGRQD